MRVAEMLQAALYTFAQQNDNDRFNHDFILSLNEAQAEFATYRKWGCLRTTGDVATTEDTQTAALPDDFGTFYDVKGAHRITSNDDSIVEIVPFDQQYSRNFSSTESGAPTKAWVIGTLIYFYPIPDAAYTVAFIYYKRPTDITGASGDISCIPARYHELIKRLVYKRLQEYGYSSAEELSINDMSINRMYSQAVKDDIATYGGPVMALYDDSYTTTIG